MTTEDKPNLNKDMTYIEKKLSTLPEPVTVAPLELAPQALKTPPPLLNVNEGTTANTLNGAAHNNNNKQPSKEPDNKEMANFRRDTVKRIKHLFLLFVRQFDVREFEIMVRFLRVLLDKHKQEPLKMFGNYAYFFFYISVQIV